MARALVTASAFADFAEIEWACKAYQSGKKFEDFADSGGAIYATLDLKLHMVLAAFTKAGCETLATKLASV